MAAAEKSAAVIFGKDFLRGIKGEKEIFWKEKFWILYQIELPFIYKSGILEAGC